MTTFDTFCSEQTELLARGFLYSRKIYSKMSNQERENICLEALWKAQIAEKEKGIPLKNAFFKQVKWTTNNNRFSSTKLEVKEDLQRSQEEVVDNREETYFLVNQLGDPYRYVVIERLWNHKNFSDIAAELGVSQPRISFIYKQAIKYLRNLYAKY